MPGDWKARTGGYAYDRRIAAALQSRGWHVQRISLEGDFPFPSADQLARAEAVFAGMPDDMLVVVDGLAFGAMPQSAMRHAARLRWVALVHHPLWLETGVPVVVQEALREQERQALATARRVIVTSASTARDVVALGAPAARVRVVEPGTDRAPLASSCGHRNAFSLLCVATITPRKGHLVLVEALSRLRDRAWTLECVGSQAHDPAAVGALRDALRRHRLEDRVRLHGEVDDATLHRMYAAADAFVLASHHEGYGMAYAEALARGLPIIGTHAGATRDTVPDDAGELVPAADAPALRAALARLLDDAAWRARLARGAARARLALPDWDRAGERFSQALSEALSEARSVEAPASKASA